jgi:hypothetical protein
MMVLSVKQFTHLFRFAPLKVRQTVLGRVLVPRHRSHEGKQMAPKLSRFVFAAGMALTILAVTWAVAAPSASLIYRPDLPLLY